MCSQIKKSSPTGMQLACLSKIVNGTKAQDSRSKILSPWHHYVLFGILYHLSPFFSRLLARVRRSEHPVSSDGFQVPTRGEGVELNMGRGVENLLSFVL